MGYMVGRGYRVLSNEYRIMLCLVGASSAKNL